MRTGLALFGLSISILTTIVACSGAARGPDAPDASAQDGGALEWSSCGPADGPATTFMLLDHPATCADLDALHGEPHVLVELWRGSFTAGPPIVLTSGEGAVTVCPGRGADCRPVSGATLTITEVGESVSGTVKYDDGTGAKERAFRAARCVVKQLCG